MFCYWAITTDNTDPTELIITGKISFTDVETYLWYTEQERDDRHENSFQRNILM